jgi:hypothetical protein
MEVVLSGLRVIHCCKSLVPSSSDIKSQGKTTKSDVIHFCTSGNRNSSPAPVVCIKSVGAKISGFGEGRLVKAGFVANAASKGDADSGGVTRVMFVTPIR